MPLTGWYHDPLHGHCLRRITRLAPTRYRIHGAFGADETPTGGYWHATLEVTHAHADGTLLLLVDFAGKPGKVPRYLRGRWIPRRAAIAWEDGNVWHQLHTHPRLFSC